MDIKRALVGVVVALTVTGGAVATAAAANADAPTAPVVIAHAPVAVDKGVAPAAVMDKAAYLVTIRGLLAGKPGQAQSDADLYASGKSICADIDAGATSATFEKQIKDYGLDRNVYRVIIRASILTFCPDDSAQIIR
jgi:hypothetical protein